MILYCVRHGESVYNVERRVQGHSDVPLSALGLRQSQAAAAELAKVPIEAVYSSPLRRARQTAEIIAAALGQAVRTDPRLMEIAVGVFQDKRRSDLLRECPDALARWESEDWDYAIPGGESRRQLARRGREAFEAIVRSGHAHAVIVAHGRLLTVTIKSLLGMAPAEPPLSLQNGSITRVGVDAAGRFELQGLDLVEHLRDVGLSGRGDL